MSPEIAAIVAASNRRSAERMARLTRPHSAAVIATPQSTAVPAEVSTSTHVVRPAFGTLAVDRLCSGDAERASNKDGKAGLRAYMALWGL